MVGQSLDVLSKDNVREANSQTHLNRCTTAKISHIM